MNSDHKKEQEAIEQEEMHQEQENQEVEAQEHEEICKSDSELLLWKDQCKRISAEFENFKKRTQRDQSRWAELAKESVLKDLLPFIDDFDRALQQVDEQHASGLQMMQQSLLKLLEKHQVVPFVSYEQFDPELHEAVMQVDSNDHEAEQVVEVFQKGFMIQDRVLRVAKVSVAK